MTTQRANAIYDLAPIDVVKMLDQALTDRPKLHRPSVRAFKCVLAYIGHRDRPRNKNKTEHYCDDSLEQIANAIGDQSIDVAADVVAVATHLGILKTVRAGGRNTPTRRTIDLDKLNELVTVATVGIDQVSNGGNHLNRADSYGEYANSNGEIANSNGVSTVTPIDPIDPKCDHQRTAPLSAAVRVDLTNSDVLNLDTYDVEAANAAKFKVMAELRAKGILRPKRTSNGFSDTA